MPASTSPDFTPVAVPTGAAAGRIVAVDALRGFNMIWILRADLFVVSLAGLFPNPATGWVSRQLDHVRWEGLHLYDLIYPLFIFLVGVSIVFSLDKVRHEEARRVLVGRILRRGLLLYALNFIFNGGFSAPWPQMRLASGVLALIAAAYVIAALVYLFFGDRLKIIAGIAAGLLLGYWALLGLAPFPDFHLDRDTVEALAVRAGSHDRAAISAQVSARVSGVYDEGRNFSNYVDFRLMPGRLHNGYYESEGLLSPFPAAAVCLLGILAGRLLQAGQVAPRRKVLILALGGAAAIGLGLLWSIEFPLVKKLWSSSFCLVAAGSSSLLLAVFYLVVDIEGWRRWCVPLVWVGMNPITLYLLSQLVSFPKIAERLAGGDVKEFLDRIAPGAGAAGVALVSFLLVLALAGFLYRRKIFLRV
jgi:predicted acyltransferase